MKKEICITCPKCKGTGVTKLSLDHLRTLEKLQASGKAATTDYLQEDGIHRTAINNRLVDLESHGLVERLGKRGKWILWRAKI